MKQRVEEREEKTKWELGKQENRTRKIRHSDGGARWILW
jgi:hypothetical protein